MKITNDTQRYNDKRQPFAWVLHSNFRALQFALNIVILLHSTPWSFLEYLWLLTIPIALSWIVCCFSVLSYATVSAAPEVWNGDGERWSERSVWGIGRGHFEGAVPPLSWRAWRHREPLSKNSWTETKFLPNSLALTLSLFTDGTLFAYVCLSACPT